MIKIRYSKEPFEEVELEGTKKDLLCLRNKILGIETALQTEQVETECDPSPYQFPLSEILFTVNDALLLIQVKDNQLLISGKKDFLTLFAENLPYDVDEESGSIPYHVHFDRMGREEKGSADSLELTMSVRD